MMKNNASNLETVACGICGCREFHHLFTARDYIYGNKGEWPVAQCANCGVVLMNPRIPPAEIGAFYPKSYYTNSTSGVEVQGTSLKRGLKDSVLKHYYGYKFSNPQPLVNAILGRLILPFTKRWTGTRKYPQPIDGGVILDVGCGNGHMLTEYKRLNWKTYGSEVGDESAKLAQEAGHQVFVGELLDANYPNNFFDVVTLWDSLEHIHNPLESLSDIYRIIKPNGKIYISVPNYGSWYARLFKDQWFMFTAPLHYYHYTDKTLSNLLAKSGFKDVSIEHPLGDTGFAQTIATVVAGRKLLKSIVQSRLINFLLKVLNFLMPKGHLLAVATK